MFSLSAFCEALVMFPHNSKKPMTDYFWFSCLCLIKNNFLKHSLHGMSLLQDVKSSWSLDMVRHKVKLVGFFSLFFFWVLWVMENGNVRGKTCAKYLFTPTSVIRLQVSPCSFFSPILIIFLFAQIQHAKFVTLWNEPLRWKNLWIQFLMWNNYLIVWSAI